MSKLNGGYVMIDLNDTDNIYAKAKKAVGCGKPVMVYDDPECYYADSISLNGDGDVVIIKGGKTININDANAVISEGRVINPTLETIKDLNGNLRFIEGDAVLDTVPEGVHVTYAKWSLSGTHLMLVLAGSVDDTTVIPQYGFLTKFLVPEYILNKVYQVFGSKTIEPKQVPMYADNWSTQSLSLYLNKETDGLYLNTSAAITLTADRGFRAQFDLLIDTE